MKGFIFFFLFLAITGRIIAQERDATEMLAALYFKQADSAGRQHTIWTEPLYGPMLLVDRTSGVTYSNTPDSAGIFSLVREGVYKGKLSRDIMVANTAINWQGRLWAVILLPLPTDRDARLNLMLHESFHRIQDKLGLPARSPTIDHLATMNGRIYFLLELQALKAALAKPVDQRMADLSHALYFRKKRQQLFPATFDNESILEMNEGLAEYTGMLLGRPPGSILQHLYSEIERAGSQLSLIRSMAYITGPVYGYLLYEKSPEWTKSLDANSSFPDLIRKYYKVTPGAIAMKQYKGDSIISAERKKELKRQEQASRYTDVFTHQRVLTINLEKMNIVFDPNNLFGLGKLGTIYPTGEIKDVWGKLTITNGGMLIKNWRVVTIPARDSLYITANVVEGSGWKIVLEKNWRVEQKDSLHIVLTKQE